MSQRGLALLQLLMQWVLTVPKAKTVATAVTPYIQLSTVNLGPNILNGKFQQFTGVTLHVVLRSVMTTHAVPFCPTQRREPSLRAAPPGCAHCPVPPRAPEQPSGLSDQLSRSHRAVFKGPFLT